MTIWWFKNFFYWFEFGSTFSISVEQLLLSSSHIVWSIKKCKFDEVFHEQPSLIWFNYTEGGSIILISFEMGKFVFLDENKKIMFSLQFFQSQKINSMFQVRIGICLNTSGEFSFAFFKWQFSNWKMNSNWNRTTTRKLRNIVKQLIEIDHGMNVNNIYISLFFTSILTRSTRRYLPWFKNEFAKMCFQV